MWFFGSIVPAADAPTGVTSDYRRGPVVPDVRFHIDADLLLDGLVIDPEFDTFHPLLSAMEPDLDVDGWSHIPLLFGEDTRFVSGEPGAYVLRVRVTEVVAGHGWEIQLPFTILADE
jgi:hypothetical protein